MATAQDKFSALEGRIMQTIELVKRTRREKQIAEKEMFEARSQVARLERELAEDVDTRMREIAAGANTADSLKVAILTALHLAQDYRELKLKCEQKTDEWSRALDQVLKK